MTRPKPIMLMILDGWGLRPADASNAITLARTPALDHLVANHPHTRLRTSGKAVGLPDGIMGNSEVGHLNIGAGRIVYQDLLRIDMAIDEGRFFTNQVLNGVMDETVSQKGALHFIGLVSDGGVHSQLSHLLALLDLAKQKQMEKVYVHVILDGRDTAPDAGKGYVNQLLAHMDKNGTGKIASICGRYYAMDRDTRWDRTEKAYRLFVHGEGRAQQNPIEAVASAYQSGETDEFVSPIVMLTQEGKPVGRVSDNDTIVFFNFRADRARQITRAFTLEDFKGFVRPTRPRLGNYVCMTLYDASFNLPVIFPPVRLKGLLGQVVSDHGLRQLRIAETEKYAHVTYFFNGGQEQPFMNEDRCLIPSPRDVPTYDLKPQMSALTVTEKVLEKIASGDYDFIVLNFANMDMVGHTGVIEAAVSAVETVDSCVGRIAEAIRDKNGLLMITADHGNAETMREPNGKIHTAHTTNPVRLIIVDNSDSTYDLEEGILGDIAPTLLALMGISKPDEMTGHSLVSVRQ